MRHADWVLPFLHAAFKGAERISLPESRLVRLLADALVALDPEERETEDAAYKYLSDWVQRRLLQDYSDQEGQTHYQLSAHAEKVFQWLQTLQKRQFVGTESRFRMLFSSLRDIVEKTEDDRTRRLEELKNRRAEIDKEIKALEAGAPVEVYSNAQVQERMELFTRLCYDLLGDFREVEDNFKQIHRNIVEQHTRAELHKGAIVGYAFAAYDALRGSDQGRSFYAFWEFLISRAGQEEWRKLTGQLADLLEERDLESHQPFLQNIKSMLLEQGRSVYEANDKMAEKLSRIISEREIARHRRLRLQISAIKERVLENTEIEDVPCGIELSDPQDIRLTMDRRLVIEPKKPPALLEQPSAAEERIEDMERFSRLLHTRHVDKKKLWDKVTTALEHKPTATLREIVEAGALDLGVTEVVAYYTFLKDKPRQAQVLDNMTEHIPLNREATRFIEVPYLLFSR
ncbi:uncharacterized protein DUF3375 [Dinghuibacter silviterrae]|uniref:Uncharacterized protein DUF3375 n=2 Tax=Dinghuibacter silviterrae TaxID=1539049 RepID=A0A4R8DQJ1_9BACT|nr:uncharacterized protein DUF3375 [Dinghuibacter silviterrae]